MQKVGSNVATSQRRDVGSTRIEVNKRQRHDDPNFATSARFFVSPSLKAKRGPKIKASRYVRTRAQKAEQQRRKSAKKTVTFVLFFFPERMMMFYRLNTCVLTSSMFYIHI